METRAPAQNLWEGRTGVCERVSQRSAGKTVNLRLVFLLDSFLLLSAISAPRLLDLKVTEET